MKIASRFVWLFLFALVATLVVAGEAQAAVSCHKINAKGNGQDDFNGTTTANVIGGGLLHGGVVEHYTISGGPSVFTFASIQAFTTQQGTLAADIPGTFDVRDGHFVGRGLVIGATGKLAGATGEIFLDGVEDLSTGKYTEDITGVICVELAP